MNAIPLPTEFPGEPVVAARMTRPEAPALSFDPDEAPTCAGCGTRNPAGNRFCVSCGARLTPAAAINLPGAPAPQLGSGAGYAAIPVGPSAGGAAMTGNANARIVCSRCNGASDPSMVYCQFCGASLRSQSSRSEPEPAREVIQTEGRVMSAEAAPLWNAGAAPGGHTQLVNPATEGTVTGRLVTVARDGAEGATYPLAGDQLDIGRDEGAVILRDDPYVSPRHLRFSRREGTWYAHDLGSVNGVFVRLRQPHVLQDGDLLLVGLQVLRFEAVKDAEQGFGPATQHGTLLFGSPMLPRYGRLCERTVEGVTRNVSYLHRDETIIGRESGDIVFTDDPFMSRRHAAIRLDGASATLTVNDLGSSNGTYIACRGQVPLSHGDFLRIGQHLFRVDLLPSASSAGGSPVGPARRGS